MKIYHRFKKLFLIIFLIICMPIGHSFAYFYFAELDESRGKRATGGLWDGDGKDYMLGVANFLTIFNAEQFTDDLWIKKSKKAIRDHLDRELELHKIRPDTYLADPIFDVDLKSYAQAIKHGDEGVYYVWQKSKPLTFDELVEHCRKKLRIANIKNMNNHFNNGIQDITDETKDMISFIYLWYCDSQMVILYDYMLACYDPEYRPTFQKNALEYYNKLKGMTQEERKKKAGVRMKGTTAEEYDFEKALEWGKQQELFLGIDEDGKPIVKKTSALKILKNEVNYSRDEKFQQKNDAPPKNEATRP